MNKMNIKKMARTRLATSRLGRALVRIAGEESGQTAMEYVVIATLICAAIAVGVWLFGGQILGALNSLGFTVAGRQDDGATTIEQVGDNAKGAAKKAAEHNQQYTDDEEAKNTSGGNAGGSDD